MILDAELVIQPEDSVECGIAAATMLLKYYGFDVSYDEVRSKLYGNLTEIGLSSTRIAICLMENFGLKAEIIGLNPLLFSVNEIGATTEQIVTRIKNRIESLKTEKDKKNTAEFLEFIQKGGKITPEIPSFARIKKEIDDNHPLIALLTTNFLHGQERFNFHFNLVTGYDEKFIYVNDPSWSETGGKNKHLIEHYLYAIYASCYGDVDNAVLLKVSK